MRAQTIRLLGLVALAAAFWSNPVRGWDTPQPSTGCCACGTAQCATTDAYHCSVWRTHGSDCVFILGGTCYDNYCIGGTQTPRPSPSRTPSGTATKTQHPTASKTPSKTATKTPTNTVSPGTGEQATATATATPTTSASATATAVATATDSPEPTATASTSATASATGTETASATATASETAQDTATATATGTHTAEASATPSASASATATVSVTATPSETPTETPTPTPFCFATPRTGCRNPAPPESWVLLLRDVTDRKDRFVWRWRGTSGGIADFGDPTTTTDYAFCLYAGTAEARVMQAVAPAGGTCGPRPCWIKRDSRRFKYRDPDRTPDGIGRIALRARPSVTRANIVVAGRGPNLDMPMLPLDEPVRAQLVKSDGLECWEATFSAPALRNNHRQFRDKND